MGCARDRGIDPIRARSASEWITLPRSHLRHGDRRRVDIDLVDAHVAEDPIPEADHLAGIESLIIERRTGQRVTRLDESHLPYISVLTDPTTGGVTASFAMLGDLNIAEPGALIGFAGPRVIEQSIRQKLPPGFQRSEFLLEHGFLDAVVKRPELKNYIARSLKFFCD